MFVGFSLGKCISGKYGAYDLEKGVIIEAYFYPNKKRKISYYEKDISKIKKEFDGSIWHYDNEIKGIDYTLQNGLVTSITFYGPSYVNPVKC